ncbi:MAG: hypothetical protein J5787_01470 [Alphaproteobacteria bacterium]|nr:hypothetical protein [Alphaproteobacteria bacterium]
MEIVHVKRKVVKNKKKGDNAQPQEPLIGSAATHKLLRAYLHDAVALTKGKSKGEAKRILKDYFEKTDKKALLESADALDVVKAKEKKLEDKTAGAGLREKANYLSDADIANFSDIVAIGMTAVAITMTAPLASQNPSALSSTLMTALGAYGITQVGKHVLGEFAASKTPEEKKSAAEYANAKHALLALKMLKKELEAPVKAAEKAKRKEEVAQLFAAGYGQPSGGLIQAATLRNQKAGR